MKEVVVENATLADAITKAARISPIKGEAQDKAAGILIELRPGSKSPLRVTATDLQVTYFQRVAIVNTGDEAATWRVPAQAFSSFVASLPMTPGRHVTLTEKDGVIEVKSGRSKAKIRRISDGFPKVKLFDPKPLVAAPSFARRVQQVAWAASRNANDGVLGGVHIDGERLIATDSYKVAIVPCIVPIDRPVTAALSTLTSVLRNVDDVRLHATDRLLQIMPDDDTQMTCTLYGKDYPNVMAAIGTMPHPHKVTLSKEALTTSLDRMLSLGKNGDIPKCRIVLGKGTCDFDLSVIDVGEVADSVDVDGGPDEPVSYYFNPQTILGAVRNATRDAVTIEFGDDPLKIVHFYDGSGFDSYLMPMRGNA